MADASWLSLDNLEVLKTYVHQFGYGAVSVGILLENTGIPIPGETITLIGGFMAGSGELNFFGVWAAALVGAIVGDNFGYLIGVKGGWPLMLRLGKFFRIREQQLLNVREEFRLNADRAVFLGRFVALLRIFAGPLAGISGMEYKRFLMLNTAGAFCWSSLMVSLAYFIGRIVPLETLVTRTLQFALVALGVFLLWIVVPRWLEHREQKRLGILEHPPHPDEVNPLADPGQPEAAVASSGLIQK